MDTEIVLWSLFGTGDVGPLPPLEPSALLDWHDTVVAVCADDAPPTRRELIDLAVLLDALGEPEGAEAMLRVAGCGRG